jgi:hypothetical protein
MTCWGRRRPTDRDTLSMRRTQNRARLGDRRSRADDVAPAPPARWADAGAGVMHWLSVVIVLAVWAVA